MQSIDAPEEWRPVVGYEGRYEVSSYGNIRSIDRFVDYSNGSRRFHKGKNLRFDWHKKKRFYVQLSRNSVHENLMVHIIVLEAFVGPRPEGMVGCHWDDNPRNNHVSNLRWASPSENMLDKVRNGNHNEARKTHCPRGHEYNEVNTRIGRQVHGGIHRVCRVCDRDKARERAAKARAGWTPPESEDEK